MKDICAHCLMPLGDIVYIEYLDGDYYAIHENCVFEFRMSRGIGDAIFKSLNEQMLGLRGIDLLNKEREERIKNLENFRLKPLPPLPFEKGYKRLKHKIEKDLKKVSKRARRDWKKIVKEIFKGEK